jgi:DNA primase
VKISQSKIDEIAASIDIVDVISQYSNLRKAGKNFMGRCPFHEEKTPSFSVSQEKGVYHCFGCGKSGNVFTFIMDIDNVTFYDAVKTLAERAGIQLQFDEEEYEDRNKIELLYEINKRAGKYFYDILMSHDGIYAKEYLEQRGIKNETITKFGLGFSLRANDALINKFQNEFKQPDLISSGLVLQANLNELRDRFRGRLMFPVITESGRVVGFGARRLFDDDNLDAKYINSPETKIYNKSKILYGLNFAKKKIKETGYALLVEGYMDLISLHQYGIENVIASSGTSLTALQVKILSRYTNEIVIVYDSDQAGQNAARRGIELIIENDINVSLIVLPGGEDPDSYIRNYGKNKFEELLGKRKSVINYIGENYQKEEKLDSPEGKTLFVREIINLIARIRDPIKRDFYVKDIAERFAIYESIIRQELDKLLKLKSRGLTKEPVQTQTESASENLTEESNYKNITNNELMLIRLLVDSDNETKEFLMDNLEIDFITDPDVIKIVNYIFKNFEKPERINHVNLFNEFHEKRIREIIGKALLDENYIMQENKSKNHLKEAKFTLDQLKLIDLRKTIQGIENKIKSSNEYSPDTLELQKKHQVLTKEKVALEKAMRGK